MSVTKSVRAKRLAFKPNAVLPLGEESDKERARISKVFTRMSPGPCYRATACRLCARECPSVSNFSRYGQDVGRKVSPDKLSAAIRDIFDFDVNSHHCIFKYMFPGQFIPLPVSFVVVRPRPIVCPTRNSNRERTRHP